MCGSERVGNKVLPKVLGYCYWVYNVGILQHLDPNTLHLIAIASYR
mgnify:CR=1 FL=1